MVRQNPYAADEVAAILGGTDVVETNASAGTSPFTISLPAVAGKRNYVTGFEVTGTGATAAKADTVQLTGVHANPLYYSISIPAGTTTAMTPLIVEFTRPIPATAVNTAIGLAVPAFGTGNTLFSGVIHGFYRDDL